jgi:hypothetical protein
MNSQLKKLYDVLELTRQQILGNDPQSKIELRYIESKIKDKIREIEKSLVR